jgi:hypothetical protein
MFFERISSFLLFKEETTFCVSDEQTPPCDVTTLYC